MGDSLAGEYWLESSTMKLNARKFGKNKDMGGSLNNKPPYRVPSMAEIAIVPKNGYSVVSTFSGCGGSCLGYRIAGFDMLWANEMEPNAAECSCFPPVTP